MYNKNRFYHATTTEYIVPGMEPKIQTRYNQTTAAVIGITKPQGGFWCSLVKKEWQEFAKRELDLELEFIHKIQAERPKRGLIWTNEVHMQMELRWGPTFWEDLYKEYDYVVFPSEWVEENRFNFDLAYALDIGCVVFLSGYAWTQRF